MADRLEALECAFLELAQQAGAWVAPDAPEVHVRREAQLRSPNMLAVADRAYRRLCERFGPVEPFQFDGTNVEQLREWTGPFARVTPDPATRGHAYIVRNGRSLRVKPGEWVSRDVRGGFLVLSRPPEVP